MSENHYKFEASPMVDPSAGRSVWLCFKDHSSEAFINIPEDQFEIVVGAMNAAYDALVAGRDMTAVVEWPVEDGS